MGSSDQTPWLTVGVLLSSWWLLLMGGYCVCQQEQAPQSSFLVSSFNYPDMMLGPYEWSYMRVYGLLAFIYVCALLAATGATRSANIILVIAIGTLGLVIGWLLEFSSVIRANIFILQGCSLNMHERWQTSRTWLFNLVRTLHKRCHWHFLLLGFIALAAAGTSWKLETSESYWIWHSLWHITIYTSFFFLCSIRSHNREYEGTEYELTQINSPRSQSAETRR